MTVKKTFIFKHFFIFTTMPLFKEVESNYGKKEPKRGCIWIINFSHCLNFK